MTDVPIQLPKPLGDPNLPPIWPPAPPGVDRGAWERAKSNRDRRRLIRLAWG